MLAIGSLMVIPDFYNIIVSPNNALIYRDGVIVEGFKDAFTNGLSQVNDAAIYQNYKAMDK